MAGVHAVADLLAWLGWYVVPFIVILSLIVAVHELGHYLIGRWCGVKIDAFSLGFGDIARLVAKTLAAMTATGELSAPADIAEALAIHHIATDRTASLLA